jgi:hypothetical protein
MIVDFAVEGDDESTRGRFHWLVPGRRKINNGQPAVTESQTDFEVRPYAGIVRAAVLQCPSHCLRLR